MIRKRRDPLELLLQLSEDEHNLLLTALMTFEFTVRKDLDKRSSQLCLRKSALFREEKKRDLKLLPNLFRILNVADSIQVYGSNHEKRKNHDPLKQYGL